ncbi:MAG TPA: lipopolysaccharide biosynthesis protein, partial [Pseudothermotoga sp.]
FIIEYLASVRYYPVKYRAGRVYMVLTLFLVASWINTFYEKLLPIIFVLFGLVITLIIYKNELITLGRKALETVRARLQ